MSFDRANRVLAQLQLAPVAAATAASSSDKKDGDKKQSLTVVDNRTGKSMDLPISNGTVVATKFLDFGLKSEHKQHTQAKQNDAIPSELLAGGWVAELTAAMRFFCLSVGCTILVS